MTNSLNTTGVDINAGEPVDDERPEFGVVDVVEAFTAMRHEWRGQTKESRAAVDAIDVAVSAIQELQSQLSAQLAAGSADESRKLAELVVDVDHQLSRCITGMEQASATRQQREAAQANAVQSYFEGMSALGRWFARPLYAFVKSQADLQADDAGSQTMIEALNLMLARLRRMMQGQNIERVETLGKEFDATTMNAIGTLDSNDYPPGCVAEQLSPGYLWHGRTLRFADVRVATAPAAANDP